MGAVPQPLTVIREGRKAALRRGAGELTVIVGCMFSGKTTRLLEVLAHFDAPSVCALKHAHDVRYGLHAIVSHAGAVHPCRVVADAADIGPLVSGAAQCIGIDEGHFFSEGLLDVILYQRAEGRHCVVSGLDRNSWGRPFSHMLKLLRLADQPVVCRARCARCGWAANRTQRRTPIINGNLVGGMNDYEPRCARCWRPPPEPSFDRC